jgi:hypothetical protein
VLTTLNGPTITAGQSLSTGIDCSSVDRITHPPAPHHSEAASPGAEPGLFHAAGTHSGSARLSVQRLRSPHPLIPVSGPLREALVLRGFSFASSPGGVLLETAETATPAGSCHAARARCPSGPIPCQTSPKISRVIFDKMEGGPAPFYS